MAIPVHSLKAAELSRVDSKEKRATHDKTAYQDRLDPTATLFIHLGL
jgi:hypothetical protein